MTNDTAYVYKKGRLAAELTRTAEGIRFGYLDEYLTEQGPAIATTLPLAPEAIVLTNGATPAFFSGLLPEGRRLNAIANRLKTSADDDLTLLLEIGVDLIGDVQILPTGGNPNTDRDVLMLPRDSAEINFTELRDSYFGSKATGIPGVQDKISSKMLNARARMANVDYILKLNPDEVPHAIENEAFFLDLAKKCDIKISEHSLLTDSVGNHALRLERFDRIFTKTSKTRLAIEDGCQVSNKYPAEKYNFDFLDMAQTLISYCPSRGAAGYNLFKQLVFNWLIGNGDAHAKNFSILESNSGEWMISPAYDLLCTSYYNDKTMALPIDGSDSSWSRALLIETAKKLFVPAIAAEKVIEKQLAVLSDLPDKIIAGALPFRRDQNYDVADFLKKRAKSLH